MIIDRVLFRSKEAALKKDGSESISRSAVKTVSWRLIGTIDTIIISWIITGKTQLAISIGSVELFSKLLLFFVHERAWNLIKWGNNVES